MKVGMHSELSLLCSGPVEYERITPLLMRFRDTGYKIDLGGVHKAQFQNTSLERSGRTPVRPPATAGRPSGGAG